MTDQDPIQELQQKVLQESRQQIDEAIDHLRDTPPPNTRAIAKPDPEVLSAVHQPLAETPDKLNEIRGQVATTQSPLSPEKQSKLMEVVEQKAEHFERELQNIIPADREAVESEVQKFRNHLTDYLRHELEEKKYVLES